MQWIIAVKYLQIRDVSIATFTRISLSKRLFRFYRSFQQDLHSIFVFAQFFGIMPICNVKSSSNGGKMKLLSVNMIYCLLVHTFIVGMILALIYYFISDRKPDYGNVVPVIFFLNNLLFALNFIYISRKWPSLMISWSKLESDFPDAGQDNKNTNTQKILATFMTLAFLEHFFSKLEDYEGASFCFDHYSTKFEAFARNIIPIFFKVFSYNHLLGVYVILTASFSTVLWNFCDVFLITICFVIYTKLKKFNQKIVKMRLRHDDKNFWINARLNYVAIYEQVKATSHVISCLVMISLLNDFFFICNQVLGAFRWLFLELLSDLLKSQRHFPFCRPSVSFIQSFYFWFSLLFLIGRTLTVCCSASMVYQESRVIIRIINDVPNRFYCREVNKLIYWSSKHPARVLLQVELFQQFAESETLAISSFDIFYISKPSILNVCFLIFLTRFQVFFNALTTWMLVSVDRNNNYLRHGHRRLQQQFW